VLLEGSLSVVELKRRPPLWEANTTTPGGQSEPGRLHPWGSGRVPGLVSRVGILNGGGSAGEVGCWRRRRGCDRGWVSAAVGVGATGDGVVLLSEIIRSIGLFVEGRHDLVAGAVFAGAGRGGRTLCHRVVMAG